MKELQKAAANISEDLKNFRIPKEFGSLEEFLCRTASTDVPIYNNEADPIDFCKHWFHVNSLIVIRKFE